MAWPPSLPSTGFKSGGITTFIWGTDAFASNSGLLNGSGSTYIVNSIRASERIEPFTIENGTGLTAAQILLLDGQDYEVTVIENTAITPPATGTVGTIQVPGIGGSSSGVPVFTAVEALVVNANVALAKKQPGERVMAIKTYTLFTPS
jgi:multidrug efflux pump subunit AcrA (membrane-fusion protein)